MSLELDIGLIGFDFVNHTGINLVKNLYNNHKNQSGFVLIIHLILKQQQRYLILTKNRPIYSHNCEYQKTNY